MKHHAKIKSPEGHEDAKKFVTEKLPRIYTRKRRAELANERSRDFSARDNLFAKYPNSSWTADHTDRKRSSQAFGQKFYFTKLQKHKNAHDMNHF